MTAATTIAARWQAVADARAARRADLLARGQVDPAMAERDAALCAIIGRRLVGGISTEQLHAMRAAQLNEVAEATELFDRITRGSGDDDLRRASIAASIAVVTTLGDVAYAMLAMRLIRPCDVTLKWRVPLVGSERQA